MEKDFVKVIEKNNNSPNSKNASIIYNKKDTWLLLWRKKHSNNIPEIILF